MIRYEKGNLVANKITMTSKTKQIEFCLNKIHEIMNELRPKCNWSIRYAKPEEIAIHEWKKEYLKIIDNEDYFFVYIDGSLTYAVNVTGDSVMTAIYELINLLAKKF